MKVKVNRVKIARSLNTQKAFDLGPIYTVYQPIVNLKNGQIFGYEALTRSTTSVRFPMELFRKAYEEGNPISFDLQCLKNTLWSFPKLPEKQLLFVNIEPVTLAYAFRRGMEVEKILKKIRPYAKQIVFEMTEGMKSRDFDLVRKGHQLLLNYGCKFALDDIDGIDSKFLKLANLNPHFIKIDMGLIQDITNQPLNEKLVRQIIEIGRKRKCQIIAEGVENEEDFNLVKALGIGFVQGYYLGRPDRMFQK